MRPSSPSLSPEALNVTSTASPATSPSALSSGSSPPSKRSFCIDALLANTEAGHGARPGQGRRDARDVEDADDLRQRRRYADALYGRFAPYQLNNNVHPKSSPSPASDLSLPRPTSADSPPTSPPASPVSRSAPSEPRSVRSDRSEDSMSPPISPGCEDVPGHGGLPGHGGRGRDGPLSGPSANGFLALNRNLGLPPLPPLPRAVGLGSGAMFAGGHPLAGPPGPPGHAHALAGPHALYYAAPQGPQGPHPGLAPGSAFHPAGKLPQHAQHAQHQMNLQHMQIEWLSRTGMFYPRLPDLTGKSRGSLPSVTLNARQRTIPS